MPDSRKPLNPPERPKRPYASPRMRSYGNIREITLAQVVDGSTHDNSAMAGMNDKTHVP